MVRRPAKMAHLPAPTKGLWVNANIADAPPGTALTMTNVFPMRDDVRWRRGAAEYASGMPGDVETLMVYRNGTVEELYAASGTKVYEVQSGSVSDVGITTTSARLEWFNFANASGNYLFHVGGGDLFRYNGSAWTTSALTHATVTEADLRFGWVFKARIWLVKDDLTAHYLDTDAITGTLNDFPLTGIFQLGGKLIAGATWSVDAGSGMDDMIVFLTDQGEVAIYNGDDPATDFVLKGLYRVGKPLGRRCLLKAGGDLAVLTEDGLIPMSKAIQLDQAALTNEAISKPIAPLWRDLVRDFGDADGWQIVVWPREQMAVVNVPYSDISDAQQLVVNIETGAWARYTGWDALSWAVAGNALYYGTSTGEVVQAETTGADLGSSYTGTIVYAFEAFKSTNLKVANAARAFLRTTLETTPQITVMSDYELVDVDEPAASTNPPASAIWDVSRWDLATWPVLTTRVVRDWQAVTGHGLALAVGVAVAVNSADDEVVCRLSAVDVNFEMGEAFA